MIPPVTDVGGVEPKGLGASADADQALVNHAPAGHGPSGFDPSRVAKLIEAEQFVLDALDAAYRSNKMHYLHFSPAWDVTQARIAAMSWVQAGIMLRRDSDEHRDGEDPKGLSGEAMPARPEGIAQDASGEGR